MCRENNLKLTELPRINKLTYIVAVQFEGIVHGAEPPLLNS